jgi:4-diphosphocytidyl-2-C-methyl-D-erythritol kinase
VTAQEPAETAPAKVNLTLRIVGRRPDGYHDLESLVVFADRGDTLRLDAGDTLSLSVEGARAAECGAPADNLVLGAARALQAQIPDLRTGRFHLTKRLPVAAGLGGGSADAAAALRLLARANGLAAGDPRLVTAARATGADVPVCLDPRPRIMRGTGERLSQPLRLPILHAVLANPGTAVPTPAVFAALKGARAAVDDAATRLVEGGAPAFAALLEALRGSANDLEAPAVSLFPAVAETLAALRATQGCALARMSGSGATCFALYADAGAAQAAAAALRETHPSWWVEAVRLGDGRV